jgi:hypothetical protein
MKGECKMKYRLILLVVMTGLICLSNNSYAENDVCLNNAHKVAKEISRKIASKTTSPTVSDMNDLKRILRKGYSKGKKKNPESCQKSVEEYLNITLKLANGKAAKQKPIKTNKDYIWKAKSVDISKDSGKILTLCKKKYDVSTATILAAKIRANVDVESNVAKLMKMNSDGKCGVHAQYEESFQVLLYVKDKKPVDKSSFKYTVLSVYVINNGKKDHYFVSPYHLEYDDNISDFAPVSKVSSNENNNPFITEFEDSGSILQVTKYTKIRTTIKAVDNNFLRLITQYKTSYNGKVSNNVNKIIFKPTGKIKLEKNFNGKKDRNRVNFGYYSNEHWKRIMYVDGQELARYDAIHWEFSTINEAEKFKDFLEYLIASYDSIHSKLIRR